MAAGALSWADAQARFAHPAFASVRAALQRLPVERWPTTEDLNGLIAEAATLRGQRIRFAAPSDTDAEQQHYELRIAQSGVVATRDNWHDLFNALFWISLPRAKAALSEQHARIIESAGPAELRARSVARDVLTLFDESGAVVVSDRPELLTLLREFRWKELFRARRAEVERHMRMWVFGHALLEKMLDPYIGITAKCLCIEAEAGFAALPVPVQLGAVERGIVDFLADPTRLRSTRLLAPLPVLGWPGWDARNASADFYDNTQYFRPGYTRDGG